MKKMKKPMMKPRLIALCGKPGSGKTTAAELLKEAYGYEICDDGLPLREIGMNYFGLTEHQVFTQSGKKEIVTIAGREMEVREFLGEMANAIEEKFGEEAVPEMSLNRMDPNTAYVLGSVRREQGHFWASHGAMVIEIDNPDAEESKYEFDTYSTAAVQHTVLNDGLSQGLHEDDALMRLMDRLSDVIEG